MTLSEVGRFVKSHFEYLKYEKECHTEIRNSNFISNSATSKDGGTIYIVSLVQCDINLINCLIRCKEYRKIICNAVLIQNTKNFSFYGCIFFGHYLKYNYNVERHGAALCSLNSTGTFENCEFISNTGESLISNEYGGAVFVSKSTFSMKNTTFETNDLQATNCELSGGAIYISNSTYFFEKCCFNYNYMMNPNDGKIANGAALFSKKSSGVFLDTTFFKNKITSSYSGTNGGAIYLNDTKVSLKNCSFIGSLASTKRSKSFGGAIYSNSHDISIENCTFDSNNATSLDIASGGSVYLIGEKVSIIDTFFIQNRAVSSSQNSDGGALFIGKASGILKNCTFINNIAETKLESQMSSNKEPNSMGGAISLTDSNIEFTDCMFCNNSGFGNTSNYDSTSKGGAIYASSSNITIFNCHFLNNTLFNLGNRIEFECQTDGAACHFSDTNANISDTEFINNTATLIPSVSSKYFAGKIFGGAVYQQGEKSTLNCKYCTFLNNSISIANHQDEEFGGSLALTNAVLEHCTFSDNIGYNGCDIHFEQKIGGQIVIEKCYFKHSSFFDHNIKSIIHIYGENGDLYNVFSSNSVVLNISTPIFDGGLQNQEDKSQKIKANFVFEKNCISPFDEKIYKTDEIEIFDQNGTEKVHFMSAFEEPCDEYIKPETRPFPTQSEYITTPTKYIPTQSYYIPTQTEQVNSQTQTEQVNSQTQTEQVNSQTQTEQVNSQTQTEQVNSQTQTEQVNSQTHQIPDQTSLLETSIDDIVIVTSSYTQTNSQNEETKEDNIPYKKIIFILFIIVGVLIILVIILTIMNIVLINRMKKEAQSTLTSSLIDIYNV